MTKNELTELNVSARSLFSSAVAGLSKDEVDSLVSYWEKFCKQRNSI